MARSNSLAHSDELLEQVDLNGFEDIPKRNLSAGQQRRLALARLLAVAAKLWVLDELFTSLDKKGIRSPLTFMKKQLASGGMIVMTSRHDIEIDGVDVHRIQLSEQEIRSDE